MENDRLQTLMSKLSQGTTVLSPLELNNIRFADKKTVITPAVLKRLRPK